MYTEYFGLEQDPFRAGIEGPGIYVGSQQATAISRLEKALAKPDSVATVTGRVGVGKTTLVSRALEVALPQARVARIERIRLGPDEVVELLLAKFGVSRQPRGTIQRFATFKRLLDECGDDGTPAVIVVEDARRLGVDALIELEAMTAADGGNSGCANIVLMGDAQLPALLADPLLARLGQRIRTRQMLRPFSVDELRDYLKHSVQLAGGEFDAIFESGSVTMLHQCSDGIPRIVNNICETALSEAADAEAHRVTVGLLRDIARDVYAIDTLPPELVDAGAGEKWCEVELDDLEQDEEFFSAGEFEPPPPAAANESEREDTSLEDDSPTGVNEVCSESPPGAEVDAPRAEDAEASPGTEAASPSLSAVAPVRDELPDFDAGEAVSSDGNREAEHDAVPAPAVAEPESVTAAGAAEPAPEEEEELTISEFTPHPAITIVDSQRVAAMTPPDAPASGDAAEAGSEEPEEPHDRTAANLTSVSAAAGDASANDAEGYEETLDSDADTHEVPILDNTAAVLKLDAESEELGEEDIPVLTESAGIESFVADCELTAEQPEPECDESGIDTMTPEAEELTAALDELEQAISSANEEDVAWHDEPADVAGEDEPGITLDRSLDDGERSSANDLSRWQRELANANSLEEMSDMLAETVFGDKQFDRIAAEVVDRPPESAAEDAADEPARLELEAEPASAPVDAAPAATRQQQGGTGGFGMSMSQRFELLRSLEKEARDRSVIEITLGEEDDADGSSVETHATIESQIDTAITQSRMQLMPADIEKMKKNETPPDEDKQSSGFFGLFKRSSKT